MSRRSRRLVAILMPAFAGAILAHGQEPNFDGPGSTQERAPITRTKAGSEVEPSRITATSPTSWIGPTDSSYLAPRSTAASSINVSQAGTSNVIFADDFELGICNGPWSPGSVGLVPCPVCPASAGLDAVITKQITSIPVEGSCTLRVEIVTATAQPLQLIASDVTDPGPPVLDTLTTDPCSLIVDTGQLACRHNMFFTLVQGDSGDGDYTLTLNGQCATPLPSCSLCGEAQEVNFTLAGTTCPADG